jgi:hypothetical protein
MGAAAPILLAQVAGMIILHHLGQPVFSCAGMALSESDQ